MVRTYILRWTAVLGCVALLAGPACSGPNPGAATDRPAPTAAAVQATLDAALAGALLQPEAVHERLGLPVRVRSAPAAPPADSAHTLVYHGLEFVFLAGRSVSGPALSRVALTDARYTSPDGLRVGYARDFIRSTLGRPDAEAPGQITYEKAGPPACTLVILLEADKVSRIEWRFARP